MDKLAWRSDPVGSAERRENPTVIARMRSGFAVMSAWQYLPGYCLLLASPKVARLEDLPRARRVEFLDDMSLLAEAVSQVCTPRRMNYAIYGNLDPYLHAHAIPRYEWEGEYATKPVWQYPPEMWSDPAHALNDARHGALKARIAAALREIAG